MTRKDGIYVHIAVNITDNKKHRVVTCIENGIPKIIHDTIIEKKKQGPQPWLELDSSSTRTTTSGLKEK